MPSTSLRYWRATRLNELDEIEMAHREVGGAGPGRRYATRQINHAYAMLLSSQFQGFCRDLHSESVDHLVRAIQPASLHRALRREFTLHRKLDQGNPTPGHIGSDFNRLGVEFWNSVRALDARSNEFAARLNELNTWRNAIAHQDFDPARLGGTITLHLSTVRGWRRACDRLARRFDQAASDYLAGLTGTPPW